MYDLTFHELDMTEEQATSFIKCFSIITDTRLSQ